MYISPLCEKNGYSVVCVSHGDGHPEVTFDLNPNTKTLTIYHVDVQGPQSYQTIEERVKAAEEYHDKAGIDNSQLVKQGFSIHFLPDTHGCKVPYFGVSTMGKKIMLYNINRWNRESWPAIKNLLEQADLQYPAAWKR